MGKKKKSDGGELYRWIIAGMATLILVLLGIVYGGIKDGFEQTRETLAKQEKGLASLRHLAIEAHPEIARELFAFALELPEHPLTPAQKQEVWQSRSPVLLSSGTHWRDDPVQRERQQYEAFEESLAGC